LTAGQRARADAQARRERDLANALAELGITPSEASLFSVVHYGLTLPPSDLPGWAGSESYRLDGSATLEECRAALAACLAKGWLQVIDELALVRIADELRAGRFLGPIYGLPPVGGVDFTHAGAELWLHFCGRCFRDARGTPFAYTDVVHDKTARYSRTWAAAVAELKKARDEDDVVSVSGPFPIGPWRAQWWRRFPEGYRIDVEARRQWQGRASGGGEYCYLLRSPRQSDLQRLQHVLDRHNVALAEWALLAAMEHHSPRSEEASLAWWLADLSNREFGGTISAEELRSGLEACLRYGWLRVVDQHVIDEV
jgi:hypothetical protein